MTDRAAIRSPHLLIAESLDLHGDEVMGWTVHFHPERAIWCGELSQLAFKKLPSAVRAALPNGMGWHLIEYDFRVQGAVAGRILAKVADEATGLALAQTIARGRLAEVAEGRGEHERRPDQAR